MPQSRKERIHWRAMVKRSLMLSIVVLPLANAAFAQDWVAYTSQNFTVYSDARESEAREVLESFEVFRQAVLSMLNLPDTPESEKLLVLMFDRVRDYNRIKPAGNVTGFFYHSIFGPRMIVGPSGAAAGTQPVLFHEYVHYLMNRHSMINYPRWYGEGLASMLESIQIGESSIDVGRPPSNYATAISYGLDVRIRSIVDVEYDGDLAGFYLTSWLFTHYLLIDSFNDPARRERMIDYLRRFDAGEDPIEAFPQSFGITLEEMHGELTNYSRRRTLTGISWPRNDYNGGVSRRVLAPGEDRYLLADIAVERDYFDAAHRYFDEFDEVDADAPLVVKAKSRRAIALVHEERVDEGDRLIAELVETGSNDPDVLADIAHYAYDRYVYAREHSDDPDLQELDRSIDFGERAVRGESEDLEALYYLGLAHEAKGNLQLAADALLKAYAVNPSVPRLNLSLARVLVKGRQPDAAIFLISRVVSAAHSEEARANLREAQALIAAGDVDWERLDELL